MKTIDANNKITHDVIHVFLDKIRDLSDAEFFLIFVLALILGALIAAFYIYLRNKPKDINKHAVNNTSMFNVFQQLITEINTLQTKLGYLENTLNNTFNKISNSSDYQHDKFPNIINQLNEIKFEIKSINKDIEIFRNILLTISRDVKDIQVTVSGAADNKQISSTNDNNSNNFGF